MRVALASCFLRAVLLDLTISQKGKQGLEGLGTEQCLPTLVRMRSLCGVELHGSHLASTAQSIRGSLQDSGQAAGQRSGRVAEDRGAGHPGESQGEAAFFVVCLF